MILKWHVLKAVLDTLYFSAARSHLFRFLPEVELPETFDIKLVYEMINKIPSVRLKTLVTKRFEVFMQHQNDLQ